MKIRKQALFVSIQHCMFNQSSNVLLHLSFAHLSGFARYVIDYDRTPSFSSLFAFDNCLRYALFCFELKNCMPRLNLASTCPEMLVFVPVTVAASNDVEVFLSLSSNLFRNESITKATTTLFTMILPTMLNTKKNNRGNFVPVVVTKTSESAGMKPSIANAKSVLIPDIISLKLLDQ
mmetsp:Transcript_58910/g.70886  ORF Transcript_58910/g.70886 Transcript_58910/m.70886 type:complete len:177 (-) Transcript_58910:1867-2397(-)